MTRWKTKLKLTWINAWWWHGGFHYLISSHVTHAHLVPLKSKYNNKSRTVFVQCCNCIWNGDFMSPSKISVVKKKKKKDQEVSLSLWILQFVLLVWTAHTFWVCQCKYKILLKILDPISQQRQPTQTFTDSIRRQSSITFVTESVQDENRTSTTSWGRAEQFHSLKSHFFFLEHVNSYGVL